MSSLHTQIYNYKTGNSELPACMPPHFKHVI